MHLASRGYLHAWGDTARKDEGMGGLGHGPAISARMQPMLMLQSSHVDVLQSSNVLDEPGPERGSSVRVSCV